MRPSGSGGAELPSRLTLLSRTLVDEKIGRVFSILDECAPVLIAFSGGADSALLLTLALNRLGPADVLAVTGVSPSIPKREQAEAKRLAEAIAAPFIFIRTGEMDNEAYRSNPINRCFFCKEELFMKLTELAKERKFKTVLDGTNADDAHDWRPGMKAAKTLNIRSPLMEAGLNKIEIREISRRYSLPTADKPAAPCLSSRIPYGEPITVERLERVEKAEETLRLLGFTELRVRDHFPVARIEIPEKDFPGFIERRTEIVESIKKTGYRFVTLDLSGFKSGSFNQP